MFGVLLKISKYRVVKNFIFITEVTPYLRSESSLHFFLFDFETTLLHKSCILVTKIHMHFYNLLLKKWLFFNTQYHFYAVIYNYFVFKTLYQTVFLILKFRSFCKNVLFITDDKVEKLIGFRDFNFLTLNSNFSTLIPFFSNSLFWSRESKSFCKSRFLSQQIIFQKVDLVVLLCDDYSFFNKRDLLSISRFSVGVVDANVNSDLFDLFIPVIQNKFMSLQLFKEILSVQLLV